MSSASTPADLAATSHDTWPLAVKWARAGRHPYQADVLVRVTSVDQIATVLGIAADTAASGTAASDTARATPVTVRALGSSVTGQPLPVDGGIVLDLSGIPARYT